MTKLQMGVSGNDCHEFLFYDALDSWWHWNGNVMKHLNAATNASDEIMDSPYFQIDFDNGSKVDVSLEPLDRPIIPNEIKKQNKRQKINVLEHFSTMAENNITML